MNRLLIGGIYWLVTAILATIAIVMTVVWIVTEMEVFRYIGLPTGIVALTMALIKSAAGQRR